MRELPASGNTILVISSRALLPKHVGLSRNVRRDGWVVPCPKVVGLCPCLRLPAQLLRYVAAFGIGLYFRLCSDTIGDANVLEVNEGFAVGIFHVALFPVFAQVSSRYLPWTSAQSLRNKGRARASGSASPYWWPLPLDTWLRRGAAVGSTAATMPSPNLADAFGGLSAATDFVLHKSLELRTLGVACWIYAIRPVHLSY
jgi:hypothetical protein